LFEKVLCHKYRLQPGEFAQLASPGKLESFRAAVDEHYRYHQFWGGMSIVIPALYLGHISNINVLKLALAVAIEILTIAAAVQAYLNYVVRARSILELNNA
jgi:hypothetical protein